MFDHEDNLVPTTASLNAYEIQNFQKTLGGGVVFALKEPERYIKVNNLKLATDFLEKLFVNASLQRTPYWAEFTLEGKRLLFLLLDRFSSSNLINYELHLNAPISLMDYINNMINIGAKIIDNKNIDYIKLLAPGNFVIRIRR